MWTAGALLLAVALVAWGALARSQRSPPGIPAPGTWQRIQDGPGGWWVSKAVWTGSEVLVVAGADSQAEAARAAGYDPAADRWRPLRGGELDWRVGEAVVWTGEELIVWGGGRDADLSREGAAWEAASGAWRPLAPAPLPAQATAGAVWTGREALILLGGGELLAYQPRRDAWRRAPRFPLAVSARVRPAVAWTGEELIVWGGCDGSVPQCDDLVGGGEELADGAAYDPASDSWRPLAPAPLAARDRPEAVWAGDRLLVWGGDVGERSPGAYGAAYDPERDRWQPLAGAPVARRSNHTLTWTGTWMLVWGGIAGDRFLADGAAYDPAADRWTRLAAAPIAPRDRHVAVWAGDRLLVWGGCCQRDRLLASGATYRPPR